MNHATTYTVKSKNSPNVWVFKYDLNGVLIAFKILEGMLSERQIEWLFKQGNFPYLEMQIKDWQKKLKTNFEIIVGQADLSFEAFWALYSLKVSKDKSQKAYEKLNQADKIKCFLKLKDYNRHLQRTNQAKAHLVTWINQRRFEDEY